jgi:hypothetical protein
MLWQLFHTQFILAIQKKCVDEDGFGVLKLDFIISSREGGEMLLFLGQHFLL